MVVITGFIRWDPAREMFPWNIPLLERPILWYGFFFALGFFLAYLVFQSLLKEFMHPYRVRKKEILKVAEKLCLYVIVGTIVGARLGDVIFYQSPADYINDFWGIFKFWEGGLSSHGGVIGILLSLWVFSTNYRKKYPMLTWVALLDLLVIPALLAGGFIRIGNFFNQEIVGTVTDLPWGVLFGSPADGGPLVPRHPVQLYEAIFYFAFFVILLSLRKNVPAMYRLGKTSGLFFIGTFSFRFLIEFVKSPQSALIAKGSVLDMGQWLSIPLILVGVLLMLCEQKGARARGVKRQ
ncbi:MAG: prolipoprotein diacylglyceryl transferase [Simkaniaceae bacterium]|nr:prolipoprotein diacylglyceryl transferase [Candidatus Sacchlamyda saccharinae]